MSGRRPEKLKSHDDDQIEHSSCGGIWCGVSMQRHCEYCMHKMHRRYIYTVHRREGLLLFLEFIVLVVVEGDSCMKKDQSALVEKNRGRNVQ